MAITINSNMNAVSGLFGGLNGGSATPNYLEGLVGDYRTIQSGSYYKLLKAYYAKQAAEEVADKKNSKPVDKTTTSTSKDSAAVNTDIQKAADELRESAKGLYLGSSELFQKKHQLSEKGEYSNDYDRDAIYKKVNAFVEDYNGMVKAANESDNDRVVSQAASMIRMTGRESELLSEMGISINDENYLLTVDKDKFMKSDMMAVKTLFAGAGSYAYQVSSKASMMNYYAQQDAEKANTYTRNAGYSNNHSSGSLLDQIL